MATERAELKEGSDGFDEDKEYGQYGLISPSVADLGDPYAAVVLHDEFDEVSAKQVKAQLMRSMQLAIPVSHRRYVEWIVKSPGWNPLKRRTGSVGWKYWKKNGNSA
ncbi:MAG: hypothetical protein ACYSUP_08590 [Planctomycetota bacterium]|jgi:hypothetical protein